MPVYMFEHFTATYFVVFDNLCWILFCDCLFLFAIVDLTFFLRPLSIVYSIVIIIT